MHIDFSWMCSCTSSCGIHRFPLTHIPPLVYFGAGAVMSFSTAFVPILAAPLVFFFSPVVILIWGLSCVKILCVCHLLHGTVHTVTCSWVGIRGVACSPAAYSRSKQTQAVCVVNLIPLKISGYVPSGTLRFSAVMRVMMSAAVLQPMRCPNAF